MNFCVISPTAGLEKFSSLSKSHLVLSQVKNPIYWDFYRQKSDDQELVILDNGAYEGKLDIPRLVETIGIVHPKVVVLPDILGGDADESYDLARHFWKDWRAKLPVEWLYIPQFNGDKLQLDTMFMNLHRMIDAGIQYFGLPRIFATDQGINRAEVCRLIKMKSPHAYVHAMGMADGRIDELEELTEAKCDSIDSSAPVWRGWNYNRLDSHSDRMWWDNCGCEVDFDVHPNTLLPKNELIIRENLKGVGINA